MPKAIGPSFSTTLSSGREGEAAEVLFPEGDRHTPLYRGRALRVLVNNRLSHVHTTGHSFYAVISPTVRLCSVRQTHGRPWRGGGGSLLDELPIKGNDFSR